MTLADHTEVLLASFHMPLATNEHEADFTVLLATFGHLARLQLPKIETHIGPLRRFRRDMDNAAFISLRMNLELGHASVSFLDQSVTGGETAALQRCTGV